MKKVLVHTKLFVLGLDYLYELWQRYIATWARHGCQKWMKAGWDWCVCNKVWHFLKNSFKEFMILWCHSYTAPGAGTQILYEESQFYWDTHYSESCQKLSADLRVNIFSTM